MPGQWEVKLEVELIIGGADFVICSEGRTLRRLRLQKVRVSHHDLQNKSPAIKRKMRMFDGGHSQLYKNESDIWYLPRVPGPSVVTLSFVIALGDKLGVLGRNGNLA